MKTNLARLAAIALLPVAIATHAPAQGIVSTGESFIDTAFLVGDRAADGSRAAGLQIRVRDGWKTYWRSPGEAGVPPSFDWSGSRNLERVEVEWPRPQVFESFGLRAVGYSDEVVLPLRLVPEDLARPIGVALDMTLGVCREICVFEEAELSAEIPAGAPGPAAKRIEAAMAARPPRGEAAGVTRAVCTISGTGEDRDFRATLEFDRPLADPYVALEAAGGAWFRETSADIDGRTLEVASTLSLPTGNAWVDRSSLRITVLDPNLAADVQGCAAG